MNNLRLFLIALVLAFPACVKKSGVTKPAGVDYYTCTMHPFVRSQDPNGKCPICSMDLVPVFKRTAKGGTAGNPQPVGERKAGDAKPREFFVPVSVSSRSA